MPLTTREKAAAKKATDFAEDRWGCVKNGRYHY